MLALAPLLTTILCQLLHVSHSLISRISVLHACLEPYNELQHELWCKSMLLVFHDCVTFVVQLSSSDTHCLLHLSCTSQTILTPMQLFLFVWCTSLVSQADYVLTCHTCPLHVCTSHIFCFSCTLVLNQTNINLNVSVHVCSLSNLTSTWTLIELGSLPCSFHLHVLRFQPNCNANFDLYWILSVILQLAATCVPLFPSLPYLPFMLLLRLSLAPLSCTFLYSYVSCSFALCLL